MCCALLLLVVMGPRVMGVFWWLFRPLVWQTAFQSWAGNIWWVWPALGILFAPWTTLMYVLVAPGGVAGLDWMWLGLMALADAASYVGGAGRQRVPGYTGY